MLLEQLREPRASLLAEAPAGILRAARERLL